jgi:ParB family chromosome partitioning protein
MEEQAYESNSIFWVEVDKIVPNPFQPRREFDEAKLKELAESIRMYGVLQPLVVTRKEVTSDDGAFRTEYELIAGERRLRASKLAGVEQVPVIIRSGQETELMKLELAIIENLQREDLNPVDRALAFKQLATQFGLSHADVAKKVGRSRVYVSNSIRLLNLPDTILSALSNGEISDGHARTLLMLNDRPEEQDVLFREVLLKKLSVREVEHLSRQIATDKVRKKSPKDLEPELKEMEQKFQESLGTRVQISKTDYGGKVVIDYFSPEDLEKILAVIDKKEEGTNIEEQVAQIASATPLDTESQPEREESWVPDEVERVMETPDPEENPQPHAAEQMPVPETQTEEKEESSDDDGLYSIKNFSL